MIAPTFEALAKEHSRPKKVAFAKINVDAQSTISRTNGVSAMPTFKIFHNGACVETIKGANPPALTAAISNAVKLAGGGGKSGDVFKTPGRTLGGGGAGAARSGLGVPTFDLIRWFKALVSLIGLYIVSLFSARIQQGHFGKYLLLTKRQVDPYKSAENSMFNIHGAPVQPGSKPGGKPGAPGSRPAQKSTFKTLADLGGD